MNRTLLVDPAPSGHRAFYLSLIAAALGPDRCHLLVPDGTPHLTDCFKRRGLDPGDFRASDADAAEGGALIARASAVAREQACTRVFFAFLDSCIEPLLTGNERFSCPVSGIWFHPYALDPCYRWLPPLDKRLRHRRAVHHALRRLGDGLIIERLFFLDPLASTNLRRLNPAIPSTVLPDPWEKTPDLERVAARARFHLPDDPVIFLHIGSSEKRKGLADTLAAFEQLAADPSLQRRILLLRVGENDRLGGADRSLLESLTARGWVKPVDGFVPEADFIEYFAAADWILLPYRNFRHSSGILSNALAANRPVIAADYGMIADAVRDADGGILFRHRSRADLARAIACAVVTTPPAAAPAARERLSPDRFISMLHDHLADHAASPG
jgi:glycosyltransferase involved in cell wall biosynthesis